MGFLESYRRLPKYQRILLGVAGIALGWYGPNLMTYLFLRHVPVEESVAESENTVNSPGQQS